MGNKRFLECGVYLGPEKDNEAIVKSYRLGDDTTKLIKALMEIGESRKQYGRPPREIYDEFEDELLGILKLSILTLNFEMARLQ